MFPYKGFLYATTDLAALVHRCKEEKARRILYITDSGQAQHFNMVFDAAKAFELVDPTVELCHVPFGLVLGEDGKKIKTRSGESVRLKELLDEAISNAEKDMLSRVQANSEKSSADKSSEGVVDESTLTDEYKSIAAKVGLAAVKYADLAMNRLSDYRFSFKKMLSLTGNTAPYMLYAYVRIRGIQRKAESAAVHINKQTCNIMLTSPEEIMLAKQLLKLEETLVEVSVDYYPSKVTKLS